MENKILYHGSSKKLKGNKLLPRQPIDLEENPDNLAKGVYATDIKDLAIAMAIICSDGVYSSSLDFRHYKKNSPKGIIYQGWPEQKEVYLYTLPKNNFKRTGDITHQFISTQPIELMEIEKVNVKDNLHLVRKTTKEEMEKFRNKK